LLIDEYQDTNASSISELSKRWPAVHGNYASWATTNHRFYGWRGAEVEHILRFQHDWPEPRWCDWKITIERAKRFWISANRLIAFNTTRHEKVLRAARTGRFGRRASCMPGRESTRQ